MNKKLFFLLFCIALLCSCEPPKQVVYEGDGLIVIGVNIREDYPQYGKYVYHTKDETGLIVVWSNSKFDIGDTIRFAHY